MREAVAAWHTGPRNATCDPHPHLEARARELETSFPVIAAYRLECTGKATLELAAVDIRDATKLPLAERFPDMLAKRAAFFSAVEQLDAGPSFLAIVTDGRAIVAGMSADGSAWRAFGAAEVPDSAAIPEQARRNALDVTGVVGGVAEKGRWR